MVETLSLPLLSMLLHVSEGQGIYVHRVVLSLGLGSAVFALASIASCRSCVTWLSFLFKKSPMTAKWYQSFYKYHTYYWWLLGVLMESHAIMAISSTGLPEAGDADANIQWVILSLALASFVSTIVVFLSCRILPRVFDFTTGKRLLEVRAYRSFYKYHSYVWLAFIASVAAHMTVAFIHAGL